MRTPDDVRQRVYTAWGNQWTTWVGGEGAWPKSFTLDAPTQQKSRANYRGFQAWLDLWRSAPEGAEIRRQTRTWSELGQMEIPTEIRFATAESLATYLGINELSLFRLAQTRWSMLSAAWPDLAEPLRGLLAWIAKLPDEDYKRFTAVIDWLSANPNSGLYLRQLPIPGVDTKWIERHAGPIGRLLSVRTGRAGVFLHIAGLKGDSSCRRVRLLDEALRSRVAGIGDLTVPLSDLAKLDLPIRIAVVVENLQTMLAFEDIPGTVVIMGGGFSVTELAAIPWLARIPLLYWGDIDTSGFEILNALRKHHSHAESLLMDEITFRRYEELCTADPSPTQRVLDALTPTELQLYGLLRGIPDGARNRLEQERIPWHEAWIAIRRKIAALT